MRNIVSPLDGIRSPFGRRLGNVFSPLSLFAANEPGVWYDPSDFSTLFQNASGTTPVTAVEQPVGLMLDKSKGAGYSAGSFTGLIGSNLISNGGPFTNTTGWVGDNNATISVVNAKLRVSGGVAFPNARTSISTSVGKYYIVTANAYFVSGSDNNVYIEKNDNITPGSGNVVYSQITSARSLTVGFFATATTTYIRLASVDSNDVYDWDNISARELPGNHASQSTDNAARPVLSARVNLLTKTEQFNDAYWGKMSPARVTITANSVTAPDGTLTADTITETTTNSTHRVQTNGDGTNGFIASVITPHRLSVSAKKGTRDWLWLSMTDQGGSNSVTAWFDLANGAVGTVASNGNGSGAAATITSQGDGWYRCTLTGTSSSASGNVFGFIGITTGDNTNSYAGDITKYAYIWGADLRVSNVGVNLPAYQRVNTSTDYDTTGFPYYLKFDGSDDWMVTNTINPGSVDKAQVFAGVRKLSDAATGAIFEWSASAAINLSTFALHAPNTITGFQYRLFTRDSNAIDTNAGPSTGFAAPITNVASGQIDIAGASQILRLNGAVAGSSSSSLGSGNWPAYPLYIGRRGGTTLPFNGQLYSLIVRFSATNLPDATIAQTETWVNGKTGAY